MSCLTFLFSGLLMLENLIVPVLNRYDLLQRMLDSIDYPIEHLLILDNGSSDVEHSFELDVPDCVNHTTYLPLPANLGVAASWNLGIKLFPYAERWFFASNDMQFGPHALERLCEARRDEITLCGHFPFWQTFALGYEAVRRLGLFDERFFPAYFEDTDYLRRAEHAGVNVRKIDIDVSHDNSSTLHSDEHFKERNAQTFIENQIRYHEKVSAGNFSAGSWSVEIRRRNGWERDR